MITSSHIEVTLTQSVTAFAMLTYFSTINLLVINQTWGNNE